MRITLYNVMFFYVIISHIRLKNQYNLNEKGDKNEFKYNIKYVRNR